MAGRKYNLVIVVLMVTLAGCAVGFDAIHDHDPAHDFAAHESYAWMSEHPMKVGRTERALSPLLESRIMSAVENV